MNVTLSSCMETSRLFSQAIAGVLLVLQPAIGIMCVQFRRQCACGASSCERDDVPGRDSL